MTVKESDSLQGLSAREVESSRIAHGDNRLPVSRRHTIEIIRSVLFEPMLLLLLVACALYFITAQFEEGFIMLFAIFLVAGISIFQEVRSEKALSALRELMRPLTTVIRQAKETAVSAEDIVVGDILRVAEGELVVADASLIELNDLSVDESILTGESLPVQKKSADEKLFAGTTVVSGSCLARVTAVGVNSEIGKLGLSLRTVKEEKTQLQQQIAHFVKYMAVVGLVAFLVICVYHYIESRDWVHSLFHGLTLAMAIIPEEIPVAVTTFMALGAYRMIRKNVLVRHAQTVEALGAATVICVDKTGTITQNKMSVAAVYLLASDTRYEKLEAVQSDHINAFLKAARMACEPVVFDPMERAIDELCQTVFKFELSQKMVHEYPLSGHFPMMTHVFPMAEGGYYAAIKGAPEGVLKASSASVSETELIHRRAKELASSGFRVLAVGEAELPKGSPFPENQEEIDVKILGLIAFSDPIKENIPDVLQSFRSAGIAVKMITGDYPETACRIASLAGFEAPNKFLTGEQLKNMTDAELSVAIRDVDVFARAMPDTKLRIIQALKTNGEVVAMTGDGVNDSPALKAANIGISMGKRGSEVARQASSLVLLNDDLSGMVDAVAMGRKIYANLKKAIQYIVSIHVPILLIVVLPLLLGWSYVNIFTPIHVIFLELIMGPTCSIVFENEPVEAAIMHRKPRRFSVAFFTWKELSISLIQGLVITAGLLAVLFFGMKNSLGEPMTRTLVFVTLVFANILLTLTGRSKYYTLVTTIYYKNNLIKIVLGLTLLFLLLSVVVPSARDVFSFEIPSAVNLAGCLAVAAVSVLWIEFFKRKPAN
jgi:Ca2+-transporting ATPase